MELAKLCFKTVRFLWRKRGWRTIKTSVFIQERPGSFQHLFKCCGGAIPDVLCHGRAVSTVAFVVANGCASLSFLLLH